MKFLHKHKRGRWGLSLAQSTIAAPLLWSISLLSPLPRPTYAAEQIIFSAGAFERSVSVDALEAYVKEGYVAEDLAPLLRLIEPDIREQMRELLSQRLDVNVTTVAQMVYSPQGEFLLGRAGEVFRTGARLSGKQGLSGAAVLAAADPEEGLTALNVIRRFPTRVLRVDIQRGEAITRQAARAFEQSSLALSLVDQLSFEKASEPFAEGISAADLNSLVTSPGRFQVKRATIKIGILGPPVDVYIPELQGGILRNGIAQSANNQTSEKYPIVVISHGVGSSRLSYSYLAQFLAQHGFAVVNLEHPGSNEAQIDNFIDGVTGNLVPDEEFINRPQLVSQTLRYLEARSQSTTASRGSINASLSSFDFNNVGVIGQSFGGYTALAVAGAPLNLDSLRQACPPDFTVDISLLLQCQATAIGEAEQASINFQDPRIKAVFAINPITDAVFGADSLSQIDVPVFIMASSADTVAPALPEQIRPFTWLTTPNRYLLVLEGATHFSTIGPTGNETFDLPPQIIGPVPEVAREYTQAMSLAFMNLYLKGESQYQPILTSAFTTRFSRPEMPLSILLDLTEQQLKAQLRASAAADQQLPLAMEAMEAMEAMGETVGEAVVETGVETGVETESAPLQGQLPSASLLP